MRHGIAAGICLLIAACAVTRPAVRTGPHFELFVLGVAQDGGLPHFGCERECCNTARRDGRRLHPASLGIVSRPEGRLLLVEATPAIEDQVSALRQLSGITGKGRHPVDAVLVTHAHVGHYLGLAFFGREVAASSSVPVHCSGRMAGFLGSHGPWRQLVELGQLELHVCTPGVEFEPLPGLRVTAIQVPHRDEFSDTMAFVLRGARRKVVFVPDVDSWDVVPDLLDRLLDGADVAYVDGTFYDGRELPDRDLRDIRHPLMTDTMRRLAVFAAARPGAVRFLHLNHTNPVLHDRGLMAGVMARGFGIAQQGERVEL